MKITVLTPTYNRVDDLKKLYKSLINQTNKEFIWFIIDDGSIDNTEQIVADWKKQKKIQINYMKKENGGKHKAINYAIKNIKTELTFIVDSDDYLTNQAIEIIYKYHDKYKNYIRLCGYSFLRMYPDGKINDKEFPEEEMIGSYIDIRINKDIGGDKAEVWYTQCLREYPFQEFDGEKFLGEDIVWIDMALKYMMVHINIPIYIGDYLQDGLTKNRRLNNIKSPNGCVERAKRLMYKECNLKTRIKGALQYTIYSKFANKKGYIRSIEENTLLVSLFYIPATLLYLKWKREMLK